MEEDDLVLGQRTSNESFETSRCRSNERSRTNPAAGHENAPSNGTAESSVPEVKRMIPLIRAILSELESKMRQKLDADHHMLSWVARHSARLLTRFRIREDGKRCLSTSTAPRVEKTHRRLRRASPIQACWGRGTKTSFAPWSKSGWATTWERRAETRIFWWWLQPNCERTFFTPASRSRSLVSRRIQCTSRTAVEDVQSGWASSAEPSGYARSSWRTAKRRGEGLQAKTSVCSQLWHCEIRIHAVLSWMYRTDRRSAARARSHNEECRLRTQRKLVETDEGKARVEKG